MWLLLDGLTEEAGSFSVVPAFPKQRGKIVVAHRRMRQQANNFPETGFGFGLTAELSGNESSQIVQCGIVWFGGQGGVQFRQCIVRFSVLQ